MLELLTVDQLAELLHLAPQTVKNRVSQKGNLPRHIKVGRTVLFPMKEVESWVQLELVRACPNMQAQQKSRGRPRKTA